jgi:hypothetical protein
VGSSNEVQSLIDNKDDLKCLHKACKNFRLVKLINRKIMPATNYLLYY